MRGNTRGHKSIMKRFRFLIVFIIVTVLILVLLSTFEIRSLSHTFLRTLWSNFRAISAIVYVLLPLTLLLIFCTLFLTNRWAVRVEKANIGGFHIIFDNPAKLYKRHIRNYLDTKRTIFKIDCDHDNFDETLDSYFEIYKFFRDEIKILGNVKKQYTKPSKGKEAAHLYDLTNQVIQQLNEFLTKNQSDYRRWYRYIEKTNEEVFYLTPIGDLQKQYPQYKDLCCGFEQVNTFFINSIACEFDIDILKWGIEKQCPEE